MRLSYRETALVAENLGQMLEAGVPAERTFEVLLRYHKSRRAREAIEELRKKVRAGGSFYEGFAARTDAWPPYFIELVRCSERAGLLYAGFQEGADHFRKMARVHQAVHRLWFGPAAIILFGWVLRLLAFTLFLGPLAGLSFLIEGLRYAAPLVLAVGVVLYVPQVRRLVDCVLLQLPVIGETVRDLSLYQFTKCFQYLYIGGVSAPDILRLAGGAVSNTHLRARLASAAEDVERKGLTFAEALRDKTLWPGDYIAHLSNGEVSGQLEVTLEALANERREALETRVEVVRRIVEPIVMYATVLAILWTIFAIALAHGGKLFGK